MHNISNRLNIAGFSTLPIILILMFMVTALILYTSMISLTEQKISSNASRATQAHHIAESGLGYAVERVKNAAFRKTSPLLQVNTAGCLNGGTVLANPNLANTTAPPFTCTPSNVANNIYYDTIPLHPPGTPIPANPVESFGATIMNVIPFSKDELVIESVGCIDACDCSQGGTDTRKNCPIHKVIRESVVLIQPATTPPIMPAVNIAGVSTTPITPPLNILNDAVLSGTVVIDASNPGNPDNRSEFAMLAGGTITFNDTLPALTSKRGGPSAITNTAIALAPPLYELGANQVVANSATTFGTADAFLLRFLGSNFAANRGNQAANVLKTIKQLATRIDCIATACTDSDLTTALANDSVVVVEGTLTLSTAKIWGTAAQPLLLIVIGDLQIQANTTFNGMVYVRPAAIWTTPAAGAALVINGRLAVEGSLSSAGNLTITNNAVIDAALGQITFAERLPGTWEEL